MSSWWPIVTKVVSSILSKLKRQLSSGVFYVSGTLKSEMSLKIPIKIQVIQTRASQPVWPGSISLVRVVPRGRSAGLGLPWRRGPARCPRSWPGCWAPAALPLLPGKRSAASLPKGCHWQERLVFSYHCIPPLAQITYMPLLLISEQQTLLWKFSLSHSCWLFHISSHAKFIIGIRFFAVQILPKALIPPTTKELL